MFKNKKIEKYMRENQGKSGEVKAHLNFFIKNNEELEAILVYSKNSLSENGVKNYERLSRYIAEEHKITLKDGSKIPPFLVRNFCELARKEMEAVKPKHRPVAGRHTTFKVYESDDNTSGNR